MSVDLVLDELIDHLESNLPSGITQDEIEYPNLPFTTPVDKIYLKPTITMIGRDNETATGGYSRSQGYFSVDIYTPKDSGTRTPLGYAKSISAALHNNTTLTHTRLLTSEVKPQGVVDGSYRILIKTAFYYEE